MSLSKDFWCVDLYSKSRTSQMEQTCSLINKSSILKKVLAQNVWYLRPDKHSTVCSPHCIILNIVIGMQCKKLNVHYISNITKRFVCIFNFNGTGREEVHCVRPITCSCYFCNILFCLIFLSGVLDTTACDDGDFWS